MSATHKKLTIGYVLDDTLDKPDGVQQAVLTIGEYIRSLGHDVHYLTTQTTRTDIQNVHSLSRYVSLKFNGNSVRTPLPASRRKIRQLLSQVPFDVLHVQMPYSPLFAAIVVAEASPAMKVVGTFHILPYTAFVRFGTRLLGWTVRKPNRRINTAYAVSKPALEFMQNVFGVGGTVLGNPIDYDYFYGYALEKQRNKRKRIVYVGRFEERKGVRQLVDAYTLLRKTCDVQLIMCGKGPLLEELQAKNSAQQLGIEMTGFVTDEEKARYLADADIAVFPSTGGESFGIVLTEAMSAGAGVTLGGNNPGYASVLGEWPETLFDPNNIKEFVEVLQKFITDDALRTEIGSKQHAAVMSYDIKIIADRLLTEAYNA